MNMRNMLGAAMAVVVLDQASKVFVVQVMDLKSKGSIDVLPPLLNFRMAWNEGVNFGLFSNNSDLARWFLITIAVVISTWVAVWVVPGRCRARRSNICRSANRRCCGQRHRPHGLRGCCGFSEYVLLWV